MSVVDAFSSDVVLPLFAASLLAYRAFRKRSLTPPACIVAWLIAVIAGLCGLFQFGILFTFFASSTFVTKLGASKKKKVEKDFVASGNRSVSQVLCNGGVASALLLMVLVGVVPNSSAVHYAVLAHYCACQGDTWSSELGVLAKARPRLILGFRQVPTGTNGGVTALGFAAAVTGGVLMAVSSIAVVLFQGPSTGGPDLDPSVVLLVAMASSALGSAVDSVLGQLFQRSAVDTDGFVVSGNDAGRTVSGINILSNNGVNALTALLLTLIFYFYFL